MRALATHTSRPAADGFIIVAVLWILGALATLVSIYAVYVMNTTKEFALHEDRLQSEALATAAIELTAYQLTATPAQSRPTRGAFDFHMANADIAVTFQTEAARIDLNTAPKELLAGLFIALHEAPDSAANYADRIIGWRTPPSNDQGASLPTQATDTGYAARTARFFHINELSRLPGLPTAVAERALPFVTVYSGRRQVNVSEAPAAVLAALPGMTKDSLNAVLAQRQASADGQSLLQLLGPAQSYATTEGSNATRVTIRIAYDNGRRSSSEVIILPFEGGTEPYSILSWHDELEPTDARRAMASR
jgi:general secretion pathway protein K